MKEFLRLDNKLIINLKIIPISPLLISDGREMENLKEGERNNIYFLKDHNKEIYIPGSTLKGLFRQKFYEIFYDENKIADIFGQQEKDNIKGSKSKIFLEDAHLTDKTANDIIKTRSITPLDHFTNAPTAPLKFEYTTYPFNTQIIDYNATLEELQTIYFILRDSINGEIRIGNSKTRGFGQIKFEIEDLIVEKYHGKNLFIDEKFFFRNEDLSQKLGNNYLKETLFLKPEFKEIDIENPNEFIKTLFSEVK